MPATKSIPSLLPLVGALVLAVGTAQANQCCSDLSNLVLPGLTTCPAGFATINANSNYCYAVFQQKSTWFSAREFCMMHRGDLVWIESQAESDDVDTLIQATNTSEDTWIGGNDIKTEGSFVWSATLAAFGSFTNWAPGDPTSNRNRNCVEIDSNKSPTLPNYMKWRDENCNDLNIFVCKAYKPSSGEFNPL